MRNITYQPLTVGDIRQEGDQYRHTVPNPDKQGIWNRLDETNQWRPSSLIGHTILSADLIAGEFRRPIK